MAFAPSKNMQFMINIDAELTNIANFLSNVKISRSVDSIDVTTFGNDARSFIGGLKNGTVTLDGSYFIGANGPSGILRPLLGTAVSFEYDPEGIATGTPMISGSGILTSYEETSAVGDLIKWSAELQMNTAPVESTNV